MKPILLILFIALSFTGYSQTIGTGQIKDGAITEPKLNQNALRPIDGGVLEDPELVFDEVSKVHTVNVTSDIGLTLASSGNIAYSRIIITATGDGQHVLTFPSDWIKRGTRDYDPSATQKIELIYDGTYVSWEVLWAKAVIISDLLTAQITGGIDDLNLVFDFPVNITIAGWTLTASGGAVTVSSVVSGSGTTTIVFDLSRNITAGEDVTLNYDPTMQEYRNVNRK